MRLKLAAVNISFGLFLTGLLFTIPGNFRTGAFLLIIASFILISTYLVFIYQSSKNSKLLSSDVLLVTVSLIAIGEIFLLGFSLAVGKSLFGLPGFYQLHMAVGFIVLIIFIGISMSSIRTIETRGIARLLLGGIIVFSAISLIGFLGMTGVLPGTTQFIYYAFVFLMLILIAIYLSLALQRKYRSALEYKSGMIVLLLVLVFWIARWLLPDLIVMSVTRTIVHIAFPLVIILPLAIIFIRKDVFLIAFVLYVVILDFYFLPFNKDFKFIADTGLQECVGYNDATEYPTVRNLSFSHDQIFSSPTQYELDSIANEWRSNDFTPENVKTEYTRLFVNGDSIKVISHYVNGNKHYGLIRLPAGIDIDNAPIFLALSGGGSTIDVLNENELQRFFSGECRGLSDKFITISPSYRGDIVRGSDYCFRSEGYTGDVWDGAAVDAVSFLETVKAMYPTKGQKRNVLAFGISRGATVALIINSLTSKLDHTIAVSTHTDFLSKGVFQNERVGSDFPRVFFTPAADLHEIRRRMITSSPYHFASTMGNFEIHQGEEDHLTLATHARQLEEQMTELGIKNAATKFYYYPGQGHGADDNEIVCESLRRFLEKPTSPQ
jgi:hypothetical protein